MTKPLGGRQTTWTKVARANVLGGMELAHVRLDQRAMPRTLHDTFVIGVAEGAIHNARVGRYSRTVAPGTIIVLAPRDVFWAEQIGYAPWGYRLFYPTVRQMSDAAGRALGPRFRFEKPTIEDRESAEALSSLHAQLLTEGVDDAARCTAAAESPLTSLLGEFARHGTWADEPHEASPVARGRDFIHQHCTGSIRVADIAAHVGLSQYHFIRMFHDAVGLPPYTYLDQVRVARARTLLSAGIPISEVANLLGYSDQPHLTRHFKRATGITPGAYCRASGVHAA